MLTNCSGSLKALKKAIPSKSFSSPYQQANKQSEAQICSSLLLLLGGKVRAPNILHLVKQHAYIIAPD